jgi:hypothetical protein
MELYDTISKVKSGSYILYCSKHNYSAAKKRPSGATVAIPPSSTGCPECWKVYYITDYALTPLETQSQRLNELEEVIHHAVEYEQKGTFGKDFELYDVRDPRFQVQYERDAHPDKEKESK